MQPTLKRSRRKSQYATAWWRDGRAVSAGIKEDWSFVRTLWLTALTMVFFAANSLLARLALRGGEIDGGSYTAVRIFAGAAALAPVMAFRKGGIRAIAGNGSFRAALILIVYA